MIRRRDLVAGLVALPTAAAGQTSALTVLAGRFDLLREQCDELERDMNRLFAEPGDTSAWQRWSDAIDHAQDLADAIHETPARSPGDLALKYDVLLWQLFHDDPEDERIEKLRAFGAELAAQS